MDAFAVFTHRSGVPQVPVKLGASGAEDGAAGASSSSASPSGDVAAAAGPVTHGDWQSEDDIGLFRLRVVTVATTAAGGIGASPAAAGVSAMQQG